MFSLSREAGFGQMMLYPRSGLECEYMGEDWLKLVGRCLEDGKRRGMKGWLYDEYNWPSGTCKGRVLAADERFRYSEWAIYPKDGGGFSWESVMAPQGWVNVCEPEAVQLFIRMTHEVYEKRLAKYLASKTILGIFTDEPGHPVAVPLKSGCRKHFRRWIGMEDEYRASRSRVRDKLPLVPRHREDLSRGDRTRLPRRRRGFSFWRRLCRGVVGLRKADGASLPHRVLRPDTRLV